MGIGTTAPDAKLQVDFSTYANTNAVANFINGNNPVRVAYDTVVIAQTDVPSLSIVETVDGTQANEQKLTFAVGDNASIIRTANTSSGLYINVNAPTNTAAYLTGQGTTAMRFLNNGNVIVPTTNVGIGTTSPQQRLHISNSSGSFGAEVVLRGSTSTGTPKSEIAFKRFTSGDGATMVLRTSNSSGTIQDVLTLDTSKNATFAGDLVIPNAIIHAGDTNTYIQFHNTDEFRVVVAGNERFEVVNSGTTINNALTVNGDALIRDATPVVIIRDSDGTTPSNTIGYVSMQEADGTEVAFMGMGSGSNNQLYLSGSSGTAVNIRSGGSTAMFIDTSQRVGMGTTAPGAKLEVVGDSRIYDNLNVGYRSVTSSTTNYESTLILSGKNNYSDGTTWYGSYGQLLLSSDANMTSSARRFLITNALDNNKFAIVRSTNATTTPVVNSTANGINSGTADFVIDNAGKIGIGTTSPNVKLHVVGTTKIGGELYVSSDANFNTSASYTFRDAVFINNPNDTSAPASSNTVMMIGGMSGNSVKTSLITTGAIGISTTAPSAGLHLDQKTNDRAGGLYIERFNSNYGISAFVNSGGYGVIGSNGTYTKDILRLNLSNGNVGLGGVNPSSLLTVGGGGTILQEGPTGGGNNTFQTWQYGTDTNFKLLLKQNVGSGIVKHIFDLTNNGTAYNNILVLDRGKVGIGTTSPSHTLSVSGTFKYVNGLEQSGQVSQGEPTNPPDFTPDAYLDIKVNGTDYLIPLFEKG